MGLIDGLRRLFGGRESGLESSGTGEAEDIRDGSEFIAVLKTTTPLAVLERHGERFNGPPEQAPSIADGSQGMWITKGKSWAELGYPEIEEWEPTHASDAGEVDPEEMLPFLKDVRRIVEDPDLAVATKVERIGQLANQGPVYRRLCDAIKRNRSRFPQELFYREFTRIPGVGEALAEDLYRAGFHTLEEIEQAADDDLLAIDGLGPKTLAKIRQGPQPRGETP